MTVVSRFARSPTGYLHIGSARTALFSWLYARHFNGEFILRIEDTDRERSTDESVQTILEGMRWLGLEYDSGPFYQTQHFDRYKEVIQQMLEAGTAYRCYCSKERLEKLREAQMLAKEKPRYDGHCRDCETMQQGSFVVRFKNPTHGEVTFDDLVRGKITVSNQELDDLIIARSDGVPTYNFTVVVDDWDMKVTHVIRGDDHINNTPRQINLFKALGAMPPLYGHLPMINGEDGKKLSKRHGAVSVMEYRDEGFLPQALLNYLVRLGWSHGDQEIFSEAEMIAAFDTKHISKSPAIFSRDKLLWLNQHYIKTLSFDDMKTEIEFHFARAGIDITVGPSVDQVVDALRERAKTLVELVDSSRYFYLPVTLDPKAAEKHLTQESGGYLEHALEAFRHLVDWSPETLHGVIVDLTARLGVGMGKIAQPIRVAVTGGTVSPSMDVTLALIGREKTLERLGSAISYCRSR